MPADRERIRLGIEGLSAIKGFLAHPSPESVFSIEAVKAVVQQQININTVVEDYLDDHNINSEDEPSITDAHNHEGVLIDYLKNGDSVIFTDEQTEAANIQAALVERLIEINTSNSVSL